MKRRRQCKTSVVVGEGLADKKFLDHLKRLYSRRGSFHRITVVNRGANGHGGGSSVDVVRDAMVWCTNADYDAMMILLDGDIIDGSCDDVYVAARRKCPRQMRTYIPRMHRCVIVSPCIERMLLHIDGIRATGDSKTVKHTFERHFGRQAHEFSCDELAVRFPKVALEQARKTMGQLDAIISYFELDGDDDAAFVAFFDQA